MMKKLLALMCALCCLMGAMPALGEGQVTLSSDYLTLTQQGETAYLALLVDGQEAAGVAYTTSDEKVAVVDHGVVMAMGDGSAVITAAWNGGEYTCAVKVETAFTVEIAGDEVLNLQAGETVALTAAVTLPCIFDTVTGVDFSSSDSKVATVDQAGNVTAVGTGICVITAASQTKKTTASSAMGMTVVSTDAATDSVVVIVGNEYTAEKYPDLVGKYAAFYDWQGFTADLKKTAPVWTEDQFLWIRAILTVEFQQDGQFKQQVLNAQRSGYAVDASLPGGKTYDEQNAKYKKGYIYNRYGQVAADLNTADRTYHDIRGMEEDGIGNFGETGTFAVLDGQLVLYYKGNVKTLGAAESNAWLENIYVPFNNMVPMSENMAMKLEKQEEAAEEAAAARQEDDGLVRVGEMKGDVITGTGSMLWHTDTTFIAIVDVAVEEGKIAGAAVRDGSVVHTGTSTFQLWAQNKEAYLTQYVGKTVEDILALNIIPSGNTDHFDAGVIEGEIDAISGASASSTTVAMAIQDAVKKFADK